MQMLGTISAKTSKSFLIWGAAALLLTFTVAGGHRGFFGASADIPPVVSSADKLQPVVNALQTGNAEELSRYFDSYVELTLPDRQVGSCSKSQAKMVLRDFFDTYRVKGFYMQAKVNAINPGYCTGTLRTSAGNFPTTLFIRQEGEQALIKEISLAAR
jgi:hypothetical protein